MAPKKLTQPSLKDASATELLALARLAVGMLGVDVAKALDVSPKTVSRWTSGRTTMAVTYLGSLAPLVYPHDPALAEEMHARAAKATLPGYPQLSPLTPHLDAPAPTSGPDAGALTARVDAVVYAACDAAGAAPLAVLPALRAAFLRAQELGLSVDAVARDLAGRGEGA